MKQFFIIVISIIVVSLLGYGFFMTVIPQEQSISRTLAITPTPTLASEISKHPRTVEYDGKSYAYALFMVSDSTQLILFPNFTEQQTSDTLIETKQCISGINAGFYTKEKTPLGGFIAEGNVYQKAVQNRLIDGFLWIKGTKAGIGLVAPENPRISVQTGPILVEETLPTSLRITDDEYARRSIALISRDGTLVFMSIYDPEAVFGGPKLGDLPELVQILAQDAGIAIQSAINLDGGNASAFFSPQMTLSELTPVGAWFCLTP